MRYLMMGLIVLCGAVLSAAHGETPVLYCARTTEPIVIDGLLDEWGEASSALIRGIRQVELGRPHWEGNEDLSAEVFVAYDEEALYLAAAVTDDFLRPAIGGMMWMADSVEFYFDVRPGGEQGFPKYTQEVLQLIVKPAFGMQAEGSFLQSGHTLVKEAELEVMSRATVRGYTIEVRIPWSTLLREQPPESGNVIGFDIALNDSDSPKTRRSQTVWWGWAKNFFDPSRFAHICLVDGTNPLQEMEGIKDASLFLDTDNDVYLPGETMNIEAHLGQRPDLVSVPLVVTVQNEKGRELAKATAARSPEEQGTDVALQWQIPEDFEGRRLRVLAEAGTVLQTEKQVIVGRGPVGVVMLGEFVEAFSQVMQEAPLHPFGEVSSVVAMARHLGQPVTYSDADVLSGHSSFMQYGYFVFYGYIFPEATMSSVLRHCGCEADWFTPATPEGGMAYIRENVMEGRPVLMLWSTPRVFCGYRQNARGEELFSCVDTEDKEALVLQWRREDFLEAWWNGTYDDCHDLAVIRAVKPPTQVNRDQVLLTIHRLINASDQTGTFLWGRRGKDAYAAVAQKFRNGQIDATRGWSRDLRDVLGRQSASRTSTIEFLGDYEHYLAENVSDLIASATEAYLRYAETWQELEILLDSYGERCRQGTTGMEQRREIGARAGDLVDRAAAFEQEAISHLREVLAVIEPQKDSLFPHTER